MLIERPPRLFRAMVLAGHFRLGAGRGGRTVYITFDDGPIPQATPWVLDTLDRFGVKATFFMVGDNVRRYPELATEVVRRGHALGNHTMHHLQGAKVTTRTYMRDADEAQALIDECVHRAGEGLKTAGVKPLFRPPHGWLRPRQALALRRRYRIVMYDLVTRDYSRHVDAAGVVDNVKRYIRPGAIVVFHDSLKSIDKLHTALPESIEWLMEQGYEFGNIADELFFNKL